MCIARPILGYRGLVETCRQRANDLAISRLELDRLAGLPSGYSSKLLGKDGAGKKEKRLWPIGLETMLEVLGLKMILLEDLDATKRTLALRTPVDSRQQRFENRSNSPKPVAVSPVNEPNKPTVSAVEAAKTNPSRAHLRVIQSKCRGRRYG